MNDTGKGVSGMREPGGYRISSPRLIRRLVAEQDQSMTVLAEDAGISRQFLYELLAGRKSCRATVAASLACALGIPTRLIFTDVTGLPADLPTRHLAGITHK